MSTLILKRKTVKPGHRIVKTVVKNFNLRYIYFRCCHITLKQFKFGWVRQDLRNLTLRSDIRPRSPVRTFHSAKSGKGSLISMKSNHCYKVKHSLSRVVLKSWNWRAYNWNPFFIKPHNQGCFALLEAAVYCAIHRLRSIRCPARSQ